MKNKRIYLGLFILFVLMTLITFFLTEQSDFGNNKVGKLYLNEVMSDNNYTHLNDSQKYSDWIELYNGYDYDINLKGYHLSDSINDTNRWQFDDITIKANSYLLVYADNENNCNLETSICHTNFKLSSKGETVLLTDASGSVISKLTYAKGANDTSYGVVGNKYGYFYTPTPGSNNIGDTSLRPIVRESTADVSIYINEYMTANKRYYYNNDGDYINWIELYNYGDEAINLKDYHLSDDEANIAKYTFPDVDVKAHDYIIVYTLGKDSPNNSKELYANFNLTNNDNKIILSDKYGNTINELGVVLLDDNISYGRIDDEWYYFTTPTIGKENNTQGFEKIEGLLKKKVVINEVSGIGNEWIELKNVSNETINLNNYTLNDTKSTLTFKQVNLTSNQKLIVYCGSTTNRYKNGKWYSTIKINSDGDSLYLNNTDGMNVDTFKTGRLVNNISVGVNNDSKRVYYKNITKGLDNSSTYYLGYSNEPTFSIDGGYVTAGTKVYLTTNSDSKIYYTTDGSFPTKDSKLYNNYITINKTTVIKAISYQNNYLGSEVITRTFLVGRKHDLAVISISTNNTNLFGGNGIYSNYYRDLEKKATVELYEEDGSLGFSLLAGISITGQDSATFPQKSFSVHLRETYGVQEITYPLLLDHLVQTFSSFNIRNFGEDGNYYRFKDSYIVETLKGQMDIDMQYYRPVVVYLNGKYWGLYNIREKINEDYLANNHDINPDNVDLIKGIKTVQAGSMTAYNKLINYVRNNDPKNMNVYKYIKTQVDVEELANYLIVETYFRNTDTGNIRWWKERTTNSKWRWVLFDLDWTLFPSTYKTPDLFYPFEPFGHGYRNSFSTYLTYRLWRNSEFRALYLSSFATQLKTTFKPTRMNKIMDTVTARLRKEMPYHISRWKNDYANAGIGTIDSISEWENGIKGMKSMVSKRYTIVINSLKQEFNLTNNEYNKYFGDL